jgi:phosphoglucosamine mutase
MVFSGKSLKDLRQGMRKHPQILINIPVADPRANFVDDPKIMSAIQEAEQYLKGQGRVLLRASGTEAVVRVMVEGEDKDVIESVAETLVEAVRKQVVA